MEEHLTAAVYRSFRKKHFPFQSFNWTFTFATLWTKRSMAVVMIRYQPGLNKMKPGKWCPSGEIGRRARFRCECRKAWGFESLLGYKAGRIILSAFVFLGHIQRCYLRLPELLQDIETNRKFEHNRGTDSRVRTRPCCVLNPWESYKATVGGV